jgi:hypothetical protein
MDFIKKWIRRIVNESTAGAEVRNNKLHDMFQNNLAAMVAFKIDNGYVVRSMNPDDAYTGVRVPGFVYCADHQAIADHIVSSAVKQKLGVQQEMFGTLGSATITARSKTAGLVGTQQANPSY